MTKFAQLLSRAIRILRGNRDESARASHLVVNKEQFAYNELLQVNQAEREKFFQSTFFERKSMSTKTAFKRVALVAAAALAIGGITAVSANAAGAAAPVFPASASAITGAYTTISLSAGLNDKYYTISSTGVGTTLYPSAATNAGADVSGFVSGANEVWFAGATPGAGSFNANGTDALTFSVYSATAGTQTLTITGSTTAASTTTITWGASPVVSAGNSLVVANNATDFGGTLKVTAATADSSLSAVDTLNTVGGAAFVTINNNATVPAAVNDVISASVSGPGILKVVSNAGVTIPGPAVNVTSTATALQGAIGAASTGRSVSAAADAYGLVELIADGTAGTSTVTVSDSTAGIVLGTFVVSFYSTTIAKLTATTNYTVPLSIPGDFTPTPTEGFTGSANTTTVGAPVGVVAQDSLGNKIPSAGGIAVTSSNTAVATVGALTYDATNGYTYPAINPLSEGKTTITFTDTSTGLVTGTAVVWVTSPVIATLTAASDAQSYDPGTKVVYTLTAADAAGNPVADGAYNDLIATAPTSNVGLQGSLPVKSATTSTTFLGGVNSSTLYAPLATANVTIAGGALGAAPAGLAAALDGATINEVDFATTGSSDTAANAATDAANEATDAANAATDAANAAADSADAATQAAQDAGDKADAALAAVTALSQQVTTVLAKVAAISVLLVRIIKKVKA